MSEPYIPGPYDHYRGDVEIDCYECLPPELKAKFRIGRFLPLEPPAGDDLAADLDLSPPPDDTPPPPGPVSGPG